MLKKKIILYFILFSTVCFSQKNYSFEAIYRYKANIEFINDEKERLKKDSKIDEHLKPLIIQFLDEHILLQEYITLKLIYHDNKSLTTANDVMLPEGINTYLIESIQDKINTKYFCDLDLSKTYTCYEFLGKNFNVISKKTEWKITNESKKIDRFVCYKAYDIHDASKVIWFTYEIPISTGPANFTGAPGLILEAKHAALGYKIETFSFKENKDRTLKMPKGDIVTEEEMNKIGQKARQAQYGRQ